MISGFSGLVSSFRRNLEIRMSILRSKGVPRPVMRLFQKLVPVQHASFVICKHLEQAVFHRGQLDFGPVQGKQLRGFFVQRIVPETRSIIVSALATDAVSLIAPRRRTALIRASSSRRSTGLPR